MKNEELMVSIRCITYNHEPYIRQCLEGFVMQKTNFKFEAIVHDDASTDGTAAIVLEYAEKYPDIIKPIIETENQYSKHDGSLGRIMKSHMHGKYVAMCEGDDYWTDPYKLQKQVDFLESHPDHSLCFCAHQHLYPNGDLKKVNRYSFPLEICPMEDVILGGGGYMATASMVYKRSVLDNYPEWTENLPVGDLPLMLVCSAHGKIGYINDIMVVYRLSAQGSWTRRMRKNFKLRLDHFRKIRQMWKDYDSWTEFKYHSIVKNKIRINDKSFVKELISIPLQSLKSHNS